MKETVHVNIGSQAFTIDQDAYTALKSYLGDIRSRLPEDDTESLGDIELRLSEIFCEKITTPMRVITYEMVQAATSQMGSPADFGERRNGTPSEQEQSEQERRRLYRSRTDRSIAGVCGGLAEFFDADPTLLRIITLLLIFVGGISIWIYIILWIVIPEAPARKFDINNKKR